MARRAKWTLGSYSRFIKTARQREGLTLPQARKLYREMRGMYERPMFASDLRKKVIREIAHSEAVRIQQGQREAGFSSSGGFPDSGGGGGSIFAPSVIVIHDLSEWEAYDHDFEDDFDYYEFEGTAQYED